MRALSVLVALVACFLCLQPRLADTAAADAPTIDISGRNFYASAVYQPTYSTQVRVLAGEVVSRSPLEVKRYFVGVMMDETLGGGFDVSLPLLGASADFDSPQLRGGLNGATVDVTLPVDCCILPSCPTTIQVSLAWEPEASPIHDLLTINRHTESCHLDGVSQYSYAPATATGSLAMERRI